MTIALATIESTSFWMRAATLLTVAILITVLVYGVVALLVKVDDLGVRLARRGRMELTRSLGRALVVGMPHVLKLISIVGTAAMLWVGGSIVLHSLHEMHVSWPYDTISSLAKWMAGGAKAGILPWSMSALLDGIIGFLLGSLLMPVVGALLVPIGALFPEKQ